MGLSKNSNPSPYPIETLIESNARLLRKVAQLEREAAQARHLAYHDVLIGLPNRALLFDPLEQAMQQGERQHKAVGLLLLDLDRFKSVNDQFGHNAGDQILQEVASRITSCIRRCDTACPYGGHEFFILLPEIRGRAPLFGPSCLLLVLAPAILANVLTILRTSANLPCRAALPKR
jgi:GGDEF domain-containing protein